MAIQFDMRMTKYDAKTLPLDECKTTFKETVQGYDTETAKKEANRCLHCVRPMCVTGCPMKNKIPDFIEQIKNGDFLDAYKIIAENSCLSAVCGRVCDQSKQCEGKCVRGIKGESISIGMLERFVSDYVENEKEIKNIKSENLENNFGEFKMNKKIAIIGSGPAGLECAYVLAKNGYNITVFEKEKEIGGIIVSSIPEYRLPKMVVQNALKKFDRLNIKFETEKCLGKNLFLCELKKEYDAIFIAVGANNPKFMGIKGENLKGVVSAKEFLENSKKYSLKNEQKNLATESNNENGGIFRVEDVKNKRVIVVGGGNVALDSARSAVRLGAKDVTIVYRRSESEIPARPTEIEDAKLESVNFRLLTNPVEILGNAKTNFDATKSANFNICEDISGKLKNENLEELNTFEFVDFVTGVKCVKMELGEADESGRRRPVQIENTEFVIPADIVVMAIGSNFNFENTKDDCFIETSKYGAIIVNQETYQTNENNIFAGGDAVTGPYTVAGAMRDGKNVANLIDKMLSNN